MSEENPDDEAKFFAMYTGDVVERADPLKLARVRVRIPGLIDEKSAWAWPMGTFGGGLKQRQGLKMVPKLGAEVSVFFKLGDLDHPYYLAGNWGLPDVDDAEFNETPGGGQSPPIEDAIDAEGEELSAEDAPDVHVLETDSFLMIFDEREGEDGNGSFFIRSKKSGDNIEYDGEQNAWLVNATQAIQLNSKGSVSIDANIVTINGRQVRNTTDPL